MSRSLTLCLSRLSAVLLFFLAGLCRSNATELVLPEVLFFGDSGVERVVEDTGGTFTVDVGLSSDFTESDFVSSVNGTLSSSSWYWVSVDSFSLTAARTGRVVFRVIPWSGSSDFTFTLRSSGSSYVPVRQLSHTDEWLDPSGVLETYHGSLDTLLLNTSTPGVTYTLLLDGAPVSSLTGTGGPLSFVADSLGTYAVSSSSGRVRGSVERRLFNFLRESLIVPEANPASLPSGSLTATMFCSCSPSVQQCQVEEMFAAYNSGSVSYWDKGVRLTVTGWYGTSFGLLISCGPNTSSSSRVLDTRILTGSGTFLLSQSGGGNLSSYSVSSESSISEPTGKVLLSGSEYGVSYLLCDPTGSPLRSLDGDGGPLCFDSVGSGLFSVRAVTPHKSRVMTGEALVHCRPSGSPGVSSVRTVTYTSSDGDEGYTDISYHDGLGRLAQQVVVGGSGSVHRSTGLPVDLVTPVHHDLAGRDDSRTYLPFASSSGRSLLVPDVFSSQASFHQSEHGDSCAFSVLEREPSPDGRVVGFIRPGSLYRSSPSLKCSVMYGSNTTADSVLRFGSVSAERLDISGLYPPGTLSRVCLTDEDGRECVRFCDSDGRVLLERREVSSGVSADTYYAYDLRDSLCWVLPPMCVSRLGGVSSLTSGTGLAAHYCYVYGYDARGNVTSLDLPGGGRTLFLYDSGDRLLARQDGVMRPEGRWHVWSYDALGREIAVVEVAGLSVEEISSALVSADATDLDGHVPLSETYYDVYPSFASGFVSEPGYASSYDPRTRDLKTCEVLSIEGRSDRRTVTYYYDSRGNVLQRVESDVLGDLRVTTSWSFTGKALKRKEVYAPS